MNRLSRLAFLVSIFGGSAALASACGDARAPEPLGQTKQALSTTVVISQFYAFGGSTSGGTAAYKNDYVELFNKSSSPVSIGGWSLQYGSTANNFSLLFPIPAGTTIPAGKYFLIKLVGSTGGADLPTPDLDATMPEAGTAINLAQAGGKIAIVNSLTPVACGAATSRCDLADAATGIVDMVGYGTSSDYEGTAAAPVSTHTDAVFRALGGCLDTDQNAADFAAAAAAPRNAASPATTCGVDAGSDAVVDADAVAVDVLGDGSEVAVDAVADAVDAAPDVVADAVADAVPDVVVDAKVDAVSDAPADTGTKPDTSMPADTGTAPEDTGTEEDTAPVDTGTTPPADTGKASIDTGTPVAPAETSEDSGCGCTTPRTTENTAGLAALVVGLAIASRRRRR